MTVWLISRDLRVLALGPPLPPIELCGVREMSVSCFLQGACSPSHSCASLYQPHLCPTHLAWRYHQMSPNVTSLFQLVHSLSLFLSFSFLSLASCIVEQSAHSSLLHSHPMVPPAASLTLWSYQCLCKSVFVFDAKTARSHSFLRPPIFPLPGMREHPPIPVADLADHIERLKANDGLRFSQEYEVRAAH